MREYEQPPAEKLRGAETRLAGYVERFNDWRGRIGTHYPATLRFTAVALAVVGMAVGAVVLCAAGEPLPVWLIVGPLVGGLFGCLPGFVLVAFVFDPPYGSRCRCDECKGDQR